MGAGRILRGRVALAFVVGSVTASAGFAAAQELSTDNIRETSASEDTPILGLRPTGVGLPEVGVHGTVGAGDYAEPLKEYHDSGQYDRDLSAVAGKAEAYLVRHSRKIRVKARKRCRRAKRKDLDPAVIARRCEKPKLAMVLDIDETSLSNYDNLAANDFSNAVGALAVNVFSGSAPPLEPTLDLYETAIDNKVGVFFITGRPGSIPGVRESTESNLAAAGYRRYEGLILNDEGLPTIEYKSGERAEIERQGFDIVLNVGDQESDLAGGHADKAFKLPNPWYFIG